VSRKRYTAACVVAACIGLATSLPAQQQTLLLWPNGNPEPSHMPGPEYDPTTDANRIVAGKVTVSVTNVRSFGGRCRQLLDKPVPRLCLHCLLAL
jgi:hypothetical protein